MASRRRSAKAEGDLSERQRYWLKHLRAAEGRGEPLKAYAKRLGLSESDLPALTGTGLELVSAASEPPRNTGPIQMLVSGLFLAPEHPMPRARNLAWCPLAE